MGGIAGSFGNRDDDRRRAGLDRAIRAIAHRGPGAAGSYHDGRLALGVVGRPFTDPVRGRQPMRTPDRRFVLGFNGEVFNAGALRAELAAEGCRFDTAGDTEVLLWALARWGVRDTLRRVNGQYAFAFYDRERGELTLARDPFGERQLYYSRRGGALYFASEIKGVLGFPEVPRELSASRVLAASRFWAAIPGETSFEHVDSLPSGHVLTVREDNTELRKHFHGFDAIGSPPADPPADYDEAKARLRATLTEAVRTRIGNPGTDDGVGVLVSGGLDSAVIASIVRELRGGALRTFSIRLADRRVDESHHQQVVVSALGSEHSSITVSEKDIRDSFADAVHRCEVPLFRAAPIGYALLARHATEHGMRLMVSGGGADELFLGYDITKEAVVAQEFLRSGSLDGAAGELDRVLHDIRATDSTSSPDIVRFHRDRLGSSPFGVHLRRFESEPVAGLLAGDVRAADVDRRLLDWVHGQVPDFDRWDLVRRAQWLDIHTLFIGYGMTCQGDRPAAGSTLQSRYPFLDPALVAFATSLPREWALRGAQEKRVLRDAFADVLPEEVVRRPKFGLRVPGAGALLPGAGDWVDDLLSSAPDSSSILDRVGVKALLDKVGTFENGHVPYPYSHSYLQVLSILLLEERFVRDYRVPDVDPGLDRRLEEEVR
ncbi:asparagine synthase (glutamine-hydrolyzing) [Actinosynnema sp. NPDC020468]|uniref:asparagine synthase (glutamine-hydrolyzing) n=1 Tax=Actinosynnema sp. NPDC020468 TaxID=3154488 RepID=UPI0033EF0233